MDNQRNLAEEKIMQMEQEKKAKEKEIINMAKTKEFTKQEEEYINSYYYYVFQNYLIPNVNYYVDLIISQINYEYYMNSLLYERPFNSRLYGYCFINNIGYPVPERFLLEFAKLIGEKISKYEQYFDCDINVNVIPYKYLQKGNFIKKIDSYRIDVKIYPKEYKKTR